MLLQSECEELIRRAQAGDEEAKDTLVRENTPLIKSIVNRYRNKGVEYEDLFQLGSMGFVKAVNHFDLSYQVRFSTYAVPMIMGEIKRFLRDDGYLKVSRSVKVLSGRINRFIDDYRKNNENDPSVEQIAGHFGVEAAEVVFAMDSSRQPISIFEKADDSEKSQGLLEKLQAPQGRDIVDRIALKDCLKELTERERKIIMLRYFRDKTQGEIAKQLGVSQVQVSRLESKILKKLRERLEVTQEA